VRPRVQVSRPLYGSRHDVSDDSAIVFKLGQRVRHASFGEGIVIDAEGSGSHARVQVNFEDAGAKWLVLAYANLTKL
jgi:DNA helicase-2/ATP-dependent DNA helicase PcrA